MINLNENTIIQADMINVLNELKYYCEDRDIQIFKHIKPNGENTQVTCPFHKGGQENKPSFGIRNTDGKCHCFTCGWSGTLDTMISEILGRIDGGEFGRKWLLSNFNNLEIEQRTRIEIQTRNANKKVIDYIKEDELATYRFYHDYMFQRGMTEEIIEMFDIGYDKEKKCITFPCCDKNGNCLFIARRSVNVKFFNYPTGVDKPLYAYHIAKNYKKVWIVESIFNALTCWVHGIPAIALIGLGTKKQYEELRNSSIRHFVLALDPDEAGRNAQLRLRKELGKTKVLSEVQYLDSRDINDLDSEVLTLREIF